MYRRGLALRREMAGEEPADVDAQAAGLGRCLLALGTLRYQTGQVRQAMADYEEARAILERVRRSATLGGEARIDLSACDYRIGDLLAATGRPAEALAWYESARSLRETLARHYPAFSGIRSGLAECDIAMGRLFWKGGRPAEAVDSFEKAKAMFEELARDHPTATEFRRELAHCYNAIGYPLHAIGKTDQALKSFDTARSILETLVQRTLRSRSFCNSSRTATPRLRHSSGIPAGRPRRLSPTRRRALAGNARPVEWRRRRDPERPGSLLQPDG